MAITSDGRGGAEDSKSPFRIEINEEPLNVSQELGRNNLSIHHGGNTASISATREILELDQVLKQMTFARSETQYLIALLHSRTIEESPSSLKKRKHGDVSRVLEEEILSPTTMKNLPDELLLNILIRLLAKQVAQMRSVSKSWNALLSQPLFVKSHFDRSIQTNDQILLLFYDSGSKQFTAHPCESPHLELTNLIKLPVNPLPKYTPIRIIGALNGLICSSYGYGYENPVIHIWNPSLSAELTLPSYAMPPRSEHNMIKFHFRFGFDPKTNDYKVVKLTGVIEPPMYVVKWWLQVEMYSMRKGYWELISERFPSHITWMYGDDDIVCRDGHDGHLHWLANKLDSERIVSFDLGSKTFREIPLPPNTTILHVNRLGVLGEKLCVMSRDHRQIEVWVMDEYGVVETWVKHYVFLQFIDHAIPFGFTSNNKLLLVEDDDLRFLMYDPVADKAKLFEKYSSDSDSDSVGVHKIVEYVDSLVWVAPTRQH